MKQGSVLSPLLFIAYMDKLTKMYKNRFGEGQGDTMIYADDIFVWTNNIEEVNIIINGWKQVLEEGGMKMNMNKTEILKIARTDTGNINIVIDGTPIKNVKKAIYLGSNFSQEGDNKKEVTERITKYSNSIAALYPLLKDKFIGIDVKKVIFESVLTPILTYASETWTTSTVERSRIQAAEMRALRIIVDKTRKDRIRNEEIRNQVGVVKIQNKIDAAQLRWLGHLERMSEERVAKKRWEWTPNGRRPVGRPRTRWKDTIEETLKRHEFPNLRELKNNNVFENRQEWRRLVTPLTELALPGR